MNAATNARQTHDPAATDERRGDGQRTVAPTRARPRVRAATSADGARRAKRGGAQGPITTSGGHKSGESLWEDDSGALPPEEGA
ncbi:hypothetical protein WI41_16075 [Burkholderia latens]|uniref:Uncharacterized protein n=1 Tax=Burkholderia latens TaxID=488446 RepID=A0AAP1C5J5_9BURK|nr:MULTISPECIES: hypothetical protein [Burkholderia]AIO37478.1 hypothetical protein DM40_5166 [Burkholderia cenocepacia]AOK06146.1 hypothetical protein WK25_16505 [Burkholderia latens]KVA06703.1 hypothetical protein WI41_16075 [Burkholderia latens]MCA8308258.1 hypothetical protein [Burkholderia sp. AU28942]